MARSSHKSAGVPKAKRARSRARSLVGTEIELIMGERERLLQAAGAAAALVSRLDPRSLPPEVLEPIHRLGVMLDALTEETLADALRSLHRMRDQIRSLGAAH